MGDVHPVQLNPHNRNRATAPVCVTMRAYEVYCHLYGPQKAMVTGNCRGGLGVDELVAFLYARSFPREEWKQRFKEACDGLSL